MREWTTGTLAEVADLIPGFAFKSQDFSSSAGDAKVIKITDIASPYIDYENAMYVNLKPYNSQKLDTRRLEKGDFVVAMTGATIGKIGKSVSQDVAYINQRVCKVSPKDTVSKQFLYYLINGNDFQDHIQSYIDSNSAQENISDKSIGKFPILLPPLPEQKAIASVLSSLDDKIDLLHRQNKTLEAMAETLFRQWFAEEAQTDWEEIKITTLFEVRDGTHDSPKQASIGMPLITSKHILDGRLDISNAYLIAEDDFNKVNQRSKVDTGDILFSMIGTIGLLYLEQSPSIDYAIKNIGLFKTSQNPDWAIYTYLWLKSPEGRQYIDEHKSGSTQEYVALSSLRSITFKKPPMDVLHDFNKLASGYFAKSCLNRSQIATLVTLRDTLLPKLMSGEVRVKT